MATNQHHTNNTSENQRQENKESEECKKLKADKETASAAHLKAANDAGPIRSAYVQALGVEDGAVVAKLKAETLKAGAVTDKAWNDFKKAGTAYEESCLK